VKRALFVSAGTVAGLVASLSYSPGFLQAFGAPSGSKQHVAHDKADGSQPVADRQKSPDSKTGGKGKDQQKPQGDTHKKTSKKPSADQKHSTAAGSTANGQGSGTPPDSSKGSGAGSDAGSGSGSEPPAQAGGSPKPKPTHTAEPKPTPTSRTVAGSVVSTPFGDIQVSITVLGTRITDATALKYPDADPKSVELANKALPILRRETLAAQSADISSVSGASFTSKGWIDSLQSAINEAGL
jgi:uncharacterized protein with FMN-binding domain